MRKIGILGGTFDPPHKGHFRIAKTALKKLFLDKVIFIPSNQHNLKGHNAIASPFHRSNMVALLCAKEKNFIVENYELEKGGISYTVETLKFLKKKYKKSKFFLLLGKDSYYNFHLWKSPEKIRKIATLVVFPRNDEKIVLKNPKDIKVKMKKIDISSSKIRKNFSSDFGLQKFIPATVLDYIKKQKLYLKKKEDE